MKDAQAGNAQEQPGMTADGPGTVPDGLRSAPDDLNAAKPRDRGSLAAELALRDAELRSLGFDGDAAQKTETLEAHCTAIMRRAELRDPRTALAAAKMILQIHEFRAKLGGQLTPESGGATVIIYNGSEPPPLEHRDTGVIVLLPDNGRGDAPLTINGQVECDEGAR